MGFRWALAPLVTVATGAPTSAVALKLSWLAILVLPIGAMAALALTARLRTPPTPVSHLFEETSRGQQFGDASGSPILDAAGPILATEVSASVFIGLHIKMSLLRQTSARDLPNRSSDQEIYNP